MQPFVSREREKKEQEWEINWGEGGREEEKRVSKWRRRKGSGIIYANYKCEKGGKWDPSDVWVFGI